MSTNLLPVFVYGTLRNSLHNYDAILRGNTVDERPASLRHATMLDAGGFPFVIAEGEGTVVGEVMYLDPATATYVMARLDRLEGYRGENNPGNMYDRKQVTVRFDDGTETTAFAYITAKGFRKHVANMAIIATGDWKDAARFRVRAGV